MDSKRPPKGEGDGGNLPERGGRYRVLARRFRPTTFGDVVGQEAVLRSLRGFLEKGRVPHAFLFSGSRGVGKTTSARILARAVNCEEGVGPEPCGSCPACEAILEGSATDIVEIDAASHNGVDDVRNLREQAGYSPLKLRKKVFILDEVHMLSRAAFNALLKILEEPPDHVLFILATTELHKVPDTVRSRCQVLPFRRIGPSDIRRRLEGIAASEGVTIAPEILAEIAADCMGGLRDAETALERLLPVAEGLDLEGFRRLEGRLGLQRAARFLEEAFAGNERAALELAAEAVEVGADERDCLGEVLKVCRLCFLLRVDGPDSLLVEADGEWRKRLQALAADRDPATLDAMMQCLMMARDRIRTLEDRRVLLELTLCRLVRIREALSLGELAHRHAAVPEGTASGARSIPDSPGPSRPPERAAVETSSSSPADPGPRTAASGDPWERTVEILSRGKGVLGALLARAEARWQGSDRLRLVVPVERDFDRELLGRASTTARIAEALAEAAGTRIELEIELGGGGGAPPERGGGDGQGSAESEAPPREKDAGEGPGRTGELPPAGKRVRDLFGARILDDERRP